MRTFAPFVVFCLSLAAAAHGANLIEVKEPGQIAKSFSPRAAVRLVNVWATWCVPCVQELADLRAIALAFGTEVSIVGISLDDMIPGDRALTKRKVSALLDRRKITYSNIYYSGSNDALADALHFSGEIPITIMYDRGGRELWRQQGKLDRQKAIAEIRKQLRRN